MEKIYQTDSTIKVPKKPSNKVIIIIISGICFCALIIVLIWNLFQLNNNLTEVRKEKSDLTQTLQNKDDEIKDLKSELDTFKKPPYFTNYFPVKFINNDFQKVGQTFSVEQDTLFKSIILKGSYGIGESANVFISKSFDPQNFDKNDFIGKGSFIPSNIRKEKSFEVFLDTPIELKSDEIYFIWIEVPDKSTEVGVGYAESDTYAKGKLYQFTRLIGGNGEVLDSVYSWQPKVNFDLVFELK